MLQKISVTTREYDVVVVGGGFAGARSAAELSTAGHDVLVIEGRDRLGGRMWSEPDRLGGLHPVEWGGAFMLDRPTYPLTWQVIDRTGLELAWGSPADTELIWFTGGERRVGRLPVPFDELASLEHLLVRVQELASTIDVDAPIGEQDLSGLDVPWPQLLQGTGLGRHTIDLWKAHIITLAGDDWTVPSALPFLRSVAQAGSVFDATFFDAPVDTPMARTLGPQLAGGTASLYAAVSEGAKGDLLLGHRVRRIVETADGVEVVTDERSIFARAVVVAVPIGVLNDVEFEPALPERLRSMAAEGVSAQAEKVTVLIENCPKPFYAHGVPAQGGFATISSTIHDGDTAVAVGFTTSPGALDLADLAAVEAAVRVYLPDCRVTDVAFHDWAADEFSRGTWSYLRPGQSADLDRVREPRGRLAFAGSDYDRRLGVEGALHSADLAATEVRQILATS